jgi:hypothetical protein
VITESDFVLDGCWYPCRSLGSACCDYVAEYDGEGDREYADNVDSSSWLLKVVCVFRGRAGCGCRCSKPFGGCATPRGYVDKQVGHDVPAVGCDCEKIKGCVCRYTSVKPPDVRV